MNKQWRLWLLLVLLLSPSLATAQSIRQNQPPPITPPKQSHYDVPGGFDSAEAQALMAQRLQELQTLSRAQDQLRQMLNDPNFIEGLKKKFTESERKGLQEKFLKREGATQDPSWSKLLEHFQQAGARHNLDEQEIDSLLRRWAKGAAPKLPPDSQAMWFGGAEKAPPTSPSPHSSSPVPPQTSLPPPTEPKETSFERFQVKTTQWLLEQLDDFDGDMLQSITEMGGTDRNSSLAELLRSVPQSDFSGININANPLVPALRSGTFSHYLSNVGDFVRRQSGIWDRVGAVFRDAPLPSLSTIRGPSVSMRATPAANGDSWLPALLSLLMLGAIVLLTYKRGFGPKSPLDCGEGAEWRLGPWPVPPGAVSTRQDVIRAFEYLALLCFGPAAAACHHRQLAERLAEQGNDTPGRRQAAEMLAWLYEQARYAPAGEALSQEQLSDARLALCLLAGVTAE